MLKRSVGSIILADVAELKRMALNWLSQRDYSENQLSLRLGRQGGEPADIALVIAWCKRENYLDQNRFLQMLVRSRAGKGYGLNYSGERMDLSQ